MCIQEDHIWNDCCNERSTIVSFVLRKWKSEMQRNAHSSAAAYWYGLDILETGRHGRNNGDTVYCTIEESRITKNDVHVSFVLRKWKSEVQM